MGVKPEVLSGTLANVPGAPVSERYRPLAGASGWPAKFGRGPLRQPTAARTAPPLWPNLSAGWTTTSVTTLAKKQLGRLELPAHRPVGRSTLAKLWPPSVERNSPRPVAM